MEWIFLNCRVEEFPILYLEFKGLNIKKLGRRFEYYWWSYFSLITFFQTRRVSFGMSIRKWTCKKNTNSLSIFQVKQKLKCKEWLFFFRIHFRIVIQKQERYISTKFSDTICFSTSYQNWNCLIPKYWWDDLKFHFLDSIFPCTKYRHSKEYFFHFPTSLQL